MPEKLTDEEQAAYDLGRQAAEAMLAHFPDEPILLKDEMPMMLDQAKERLASLEAMGWNAVWASEENHRRFQAQKKARGGQEMSDYEKAIAVQGLIDAAVRRHDA